MSNDIGRSVAAALYAERSAALARRYAQEGTEPTQLEPEGIEGSARRHARIERLGLWLLIVLTLAVGVTAWSHEASYSPKPDAAYIGTAMVCDRNGCVER